MWNKNYTGWTIILLLSLLTTSILFAQEKTCYKSDTNAIDRISFSSDSEIYRYDLNTTTFANTIPNIDLSFCDLERSVLATNLYAQVDINRTKTVGNVSPKTTFRLTITHSGDATGTTFPGVGVYEYPSGQTVGISVATTNGVYFGGWSGDAAGSSEFIQVVMDSDKSIDARFTSTGHILNVNIIGEGGTTPGPFGNPHRYSSDVYVNIVTYQTNPLWRFEHWEGDYGENDPNSYILFNLLMDQDRNITAVFIPKPYYDLTIEIIGNGNVSLQEDFEDPIILTPGLYSYTYLEWTYIRCERIETTEGWKFLRWEGDFGDMSATYPRCAFSMDKHRHVRCIFTDKAQVPNVVGIKQSEATTAITKAWLTVGDITEACNDEYPSGYVINQDPPAGTTVEIGSSVSLVLSTGPCPVTVPNVVGMTTAEVETALTNVRLLLGNITEQCNNEVEAGRVISQNPMEGTILPPGSMVDVVVSLGPCPVTVPNIIWQFRFDAENMIANAGLEIGIVTEQCDDLIPANRVINQYPQAGLQVPSGTEVNFTVSAGPCLITVPNIVQYSQTMAQNIILAAGLTVGEVTEQCHPSIRKGIVISQSPSAGQKVPPNSSVDFVISSGPCSEGMQEGVPEGIEGEGIVEGSAEGFPEGVEGEGISEGSTEGSSEGIEGEGALEGTTEGVEGEGVLEGSVEGEGISEGSVEGAPEGIEGEGEGEKPPHSADPNGDWQINLSELLRVIQFFNSGGYHCALPEEVSEDGYIPGIDGDKSCVPHSSDYNPQDWTIGLSELLRLIQFFNFGGYHACLDGEDGYCPGI